MKIVALLGVKDEVEVIGATINQLRSIGVDLIIAYDDGSTDGTLDVLEALKSKDHVWVVNVERAEPWKEAITETWRLAWARKANADWVLFSDADEFWIPATGSLRDCCSLANTDILTVDRFNVPLTRRRPLVPDELSPSSYGDLLLCVKTIPDFHLYIEQHPETPWILGASIAPKVLARRDVIGRVGAGGHAVEPIGDRPWRRARPADLLIAHLPFTTYERFERKVRNIGEVIRVCPEFFSGYVAWHWRRWASMLKAGRLREEFEHQMFSDRLLSDLLDAGVIRTASAIFAQAEVRPG
jgi:glycosyltransferase involved in cell wall biosynthesis